MEYLNFSLPFKKTKSLQLTILVDMDLTQEIYLNTSDKTDYFCLETQMSLQKWRF